MFKNQSEKFEEIENLLHAFVFLILCNYSEEY